MDPLALLKELVAIPSVNPMGRDLSGPEYYEGRLSDYLEEFFRALGVDYERYSVSPGRDNVVARYFGAAEGLILLDAHQDTVPVDGMTIDPFDPVERDGKLYGRGACDVKGGMAAMLSAFARLVREKPAGVPSVLMSCTCDEEATATGIHHLVRLWSEPGRSRLVDRRPDLAIVAEPTELDIVVAHRGATRWKLRTTGRACHSSNPRNGINAIYRMARVVSCLEEYAANIHTIVKPHPLCGPPTLSVGRIEGGISVNTVPDCCEIEIDRRVIPGEDGSKVIGQVHEHLRSRLDFEVEMLPPWIVGESLPDDHNGPLAERLMRHIAEVAGPHRCVGVPYGTHASRTAGGGVPSVVFGPGSIAQAHTEDEWIDIGQLGQAAEIYFRFCATGV